MGDTSLANTAFLCSSAYQTLKQAGLTDEGARRLGAHVASLVHLMARLQHEAAMLGPDTPAGFKQAVKSVLQAVQEAKQLSDEVFAVQQPGFGYKVIRVLQSDSTARQFARVSRHLHQALGSLRDALSHPNLQQHKVTVQALRQQLANSAYQSAQERERHEKLIRLLGDKPSQRLSDQQLQELAQQVALVLGGACGQVVQGDVDDMTAYLRVLREKVDIKGEQRLRQMIEVAKFLNSGDASAVKAPPKELICPLTGELMQDPVMLAASGETFERAAIVDHLHQLKHHGLPLVCPITNTTIQLPIKLVHQRWVRSLIEEWCSSLGRPTPLKRSLQLRPSVNTAGSSNSGEDMVLRTAASDPTTGAADRRRHNTG